MRDVATLVVEVAFVVVFARSFVVYLRHRDRVQRDVTLVFTAMAAVFVVELWERVAGPPPGWVAGLSSVLLLAQPHLTLRLVAQVRPVRRPLRIAALLGFLVTALPFAPGRDAAAPVVLAAVAVFVGVEGLAAGFLYGEARRRSGSPRVRLMAAAWATAAFAVAILAAGAGAAGGRTDTAAGDVALVVALASGVGYLVAFVPPRWLRRSWSRSAASAVIDRLLHAPADEAPEHTWQRYVDTVCAVSGADAAVVLLADPNGGIREAAGVGMPVDPAAVYAAQALAEVLDASQPVTADPATAPTLATSLAGRVAARYVTAVPLGLRSGRPGALVVANAYRRLFADDDMTVLGELGAQAGLLAERATLLAEQERLNAELAASVDAMALASKAKSDFLTNMSHELRTPLNAIIGFADLMDTDDTDAEGRKSVPAEWVGHIRSSGRHLLDLINDILDLAKVEAGRIDLKPEPLTLPTIVGEVVTTLRPLFDHKDLRVTTDVPAITVTADRIRLRQILDNLLSNAVKFTPASGHIEVRVEQTDTEVRLTVADSGVGIAQEDQKTVFDEFTQVGDTAARQAGTGLGLALTRRLVQAHGGHIDLHSEPGVGSDFTVCLPRDRSSRTHADLATPNHTAPEPRSAGILIIEDDPAAATLLTRHLAEVGYPASVATTGAQGLEHARQHRPQAIVLDILLPDTDGWQLLRQLKSNPATCDIPIIVTTLLDEHEVGYALGATDYLTKPVNPDALIALLTRHALLPPPPATAAVLAIDDDPATLDLVTATLDQHGAATTTALTGSAGLALARQHPYDLIICDVLLPDIDGFTITATLNADPATRNIPIIVLTATDLTHADKARLSSHVLDVVHKGATAREQLSLWLAKIHQPSDGSPPHEASHEAAPDPQRRVHPTSERRPPHRPGTA